MKVNQCHLAIALAVVTMALGASAQQQECVLPVEPAPLGKTLYRIGVLANRGVETVYQEWNATATYLTQTAGTLFDPPLTFETVPIVFDDNVLDQLEASDLHDFIFANPTLTSCVTSELPAAQSLATLIAKRKVGGAVYELTNFGGVMITQADNRDIETLADIRDKRVGLISISGLGR